MKRTILTTLLTVGLLGPVMHIRAEDIDLYKAADGAPGLKPNVLFMIDNSANWNSKAGGESKRIIEHQALHDIFSSQKYTDQLRVGVMVFAHGDTPKGGKVYRAIEDLTEAYGNELALLFDNINDPDAIKGTNNAPYALMMNEAYLYFGGKQPRAGTQDGNHDPAAVSGGQYVSPAVNECGLNYVILIGNGQPDSGESNDAEAVLRDYRGVLSTDPISVNPDKYESNWSDEFARFMSTSDIDTVQPDKQTVSTYVIDVYDAAESNTLPNRAAHAWLNSISKWGDGRYYPAHSVGDIKAAIEGVLSELQAVNSVFAAAALPVSVNVRGTNLNQVYMGQFRPDKQDRPRWLGNLKLYQLAVDPTNDTVFLADANGKPAQSPVTGFIASSAQSFWTEASTYWSFKPSGAPPSPSDSPDGEVVEKGAAAQQLRERNQTATSGYALTRSLYTCTGCTGSLSNFNTSNSAISAAALGVVSSTERDDLINWVLGNDNVSDATGYTEDGDSETTDVRPSIHGDVLHSTPAVVNYNNTSSDAVVMVYYGANDGIIHAVQGGKNVSAGDGQELWGFIPEEFFGKLNLLRGNTTSGKPYFADGSIGTYTLDQNKDGILSHGDSDKVYLYISMRRGGRFIYALDVSNRNSPRLLWQRDFNDSGYRELGQSWSKPNLATISNGSGGSKPVVVFGAGYDPAIDDDRAVTSGQTMGRGIFVVDAVTGDVIWQAGPQNPGGSGVFKQVTDMTYSIPSDVTVIDRNGDGRDDRLYVGDTGGNVWRVNIGDADPENWAVSKLASIGAAAGLAERKFVYPPDVVYGKDANGPYVAVLIGSGDREDPFETAVENRFYMFKDRSAGTTINETELYDVTSNTIQVGGTETERQQAQTLLDDARGWYLRLTNPGEKVVGGPVTLSEAVFFNTMQPPLPEQTTCQSLGTARFYTVSYKDGTAVLNNDGMLGLSTTDRFKTGVGGGFPPSPVPAIVEIDGKKYQAVISGTEVQEPPGLDLGARHRVFWYKEME